MALQFPSPFKLEFTLKQHTPIIHFQHDQVGATLRATEVKPKLDRFILTKLGEGDYNAGVEKAKKSKWFIGDKDDSRALNYKLRFIAPSTKQDYVIASTIPKPLIWQYEKEGKKVLANTPYFANNEPIKKGKLDEATLGILTNDDIKVIVDCNISSLRGEIKTHFPSLLVIENFGLRQNKGFGCFVTNNMSQDDFEETLRANYGEQRLYFKHFSSLEEAYKGLDREYKILKSGIAKDPSQLKIYAKDNYNVDWEKEAIKDVLVKGRGRNKTIDWTDKEQTKYVRALLGVAELYEFPKSNTKVIVDSEQIKRFKSPLTFKIFKKGNTYTVYLLVEQFNDLIYDKTFNFKNKDTSDILQLKTPHFEDGWLADFIYNHLHESWHNL